MQFLNYILRLDRLPITLAYRQWRQVLKKMVKVVTSCNEISFLFWGSSLVSNTQTLTPRPEGLGPNMFVHCDERVAESFPMIRSGHRPLIG